ncbi:MAG: hypothetical protein GY943_17855, partial [Chloroflexi bacterium]|nr:hypothetical protein [Chloroflexota bacterium]
AKSVHPMAFEFPRRNANQLFFPTVHVHHGQVEPKAEFHHVLYCQSATKHVGWQHSGMKAATFVNIDKSLGMVESELTIQMLSLQGIFANEDVVLDESH